eukprot:TRINITY_DN14155_c0_g1_i1.p1 TRINITY_DN14155_c0_g1~~TRINITY_DN14155_c0_g1_i1.p1  ORF type:complete len:865 (-),score=223.82 TRINITY_DN14155_c0_g1_i1:90-2684(-)
MDRYEQLRVLGRGAFGVAYLVREKDAAPETFRVIKQVDLEQLPADKRKETLNEVSVLQRLDHINIVCYVGAFLERSVLHIVMEFADGGDLAGIVRQRRETEQPFAEEDALTVFAQCVFGLSHMHRNKILHRDIKGQNIFVTKSGMAKLGDFGIARVFEHTESQAWTTIGTPSYLAPEVCENLPYDSKADVWSLGVVLYEMAALRQPFQAYNIAALVIRILTAEPPPLPAAYSDVLRNLTTRMLKKKADERPSAEELLLVTEVRQRVADRFSVTGGGTTRPGSRGTAGQQRPGSRGARPRPVSRGSATAAASGRPRSSPAVDNGEAAARETTRERGEVLREESLFVPVGDAWQNSQPADQLDLLVATTKGGPLGAKDAVLEKTAYEAIPISGDCPAVAMGAPSAEEQRRLNGLIAQRARARCMGEQWPIRHETSADDERPTTASSGEPLITLYRTSVEKIGLDIQCLDEQQQLRSDILISGVEAGGLVDRWNSANPMQAVRTGHRIVQVNGVREDAMRMLEELRSAKVLNLAVRPTSAANQRGHAASPLASTARSPASRSPLLHAGGAVVTAESTLAPSRPGSGCGSRPGSSSASARALPPATAAAAASRPGSSSRTGPRLSAGAEGTASSGSLNRRPPSSGAGGSVVARGRTAEARRDARRTPSSGAVRRSSGGSGSPHADLAAFMERVEAMQQQEAAAAAASASPASASPAAEARRPSRPSSGGSAAATAGAGAEAASLDAAAAAERFPWAARMANAELSMPLVVREEPLVRRHEDNMSELIDQIAKLSEETGDKAGAAAASRGRDGADFTESWGVAELPAGLSGATADLTDSWSEATGVCDAQPPSPSCDTAAALERVLLGG